MQFFVYFCCQEVSILGALWTYGLCRTIIAGKESVGINAMFIEVISGMLCDVLNLDKMYSLTLLQYLD